MAANPAGTRLYVTNGGSSSISVIDAATNMVIATIPVGGAPSAAAGTRVYVANSSLSSVSVIDAATNMVIATIPVGKQGE